MGTKSEGQRVLGMVVYAYNPSTPDVDQENHEFHDQENHEFQTTLGFIVRTCLNKTKQQQQKRSVSILGDSGVYPCASLILRVQT